MFTTAQVDQMNRTLEEEPNIPVDRLKKAIGSSNWQAVKNFIGVCKSEAETVVRHDSIEAFPMNRLASVAEPYDYSMVQPVDSNLQALEQIIGTANLSVTLAREHLEKCVKFLADVEDIRKRYEEGDLTVT